VDVAAEQPAVRGGGVEVRVRLHNEAVVPQGVTLTASVDGALAAAEPVELPAGGDANATLRVLAEAGSHEVLVQAVLPALPALGGQPAPSPGANGATSGATGASAGAPMPTSAMDMSGGPAAVLRVEVPIGAAMPPPAPVGLAPLPSPRLQDALAQKEAVPKTPGFEAALVALALLAAAGARRRSGPR
jgi:MYXO-CTERM domain-containing protein